MALIISKFVQRPRFFCDFRFIEVVICHIKLVRQLIKILICVVIQGLVISVCDIRYRSRYRNKLNSPGFAEFRQPDKVFQ